MSAPLDPIAIEPTRTIRGLVGANVAALPYISGFACLARTMRLNGFCKSDVFAVFGIRVTQGLNFLALTQQKGQGQGALARNLDLDLGDVPRFWSPTLWSPIDLQGQWDFRQPLRLCATCAKYGYHSTLFQMPWVDRCPWHGDRLIHECRRCLRRFPVMLDAGDAFFRCSCGLDLLDRCKATIDLATFPTTLAATRIERYLAWASVQARSRRLILPSNCDGWFSALPTLVQLPQRFSGAFRFSMQHRHPHVWSANFSTASDPEAGAFNGWMDIRKGHTIQLAKLPDSLRKPLRHIGWQTVSACPPSALTHEEWAAFGITRPRNDCKDAAGRSEFVFLPVGRRLGYGTWIYLLAVIREAVELCSRVLDVAERDMVEEDTLAAPLAPDMALSRALDRLQTRGVILRLLEHLLCRGYAGGLRIVLARHMPELYRHAKTAPASWLPIVEMHIVNREVTEVRVAWIKRRNMDTDVPFVAKARPRRRLRRTPRRRAR